LASTDRNPLEPLGVRAAAHAALARVLADAGLLEEALAACSQAVDCTSTLQADRPQQAKHLIQRAGLRLQLMQAGASAATQNLSQSQWQQALADITHALSSGK
jgi:hypothetical protein